jgi:hypothetical protein
MATADFSTIVHSLDLLTPGEQQQLSSILAEKLQLPRSASQLGVTASDQPKFRSQKGLVTMTEADWDQLAKDPNIQRELRDIESEFSPTLLDGLEQE